MKNIYTKTIYLIFFVVLVLVIFLYVKKDKRMLSSEKLVETLFKYKELESFQSYQHGEAELKNKFFQENPKDKNKNIALLRFSFNSMDKLRSDINKDNLREKILDHLLEDEKNIHLASKILTDFSFVHQKFGVDQAIARIYSIKLLTRAAERGNIDYLKNTTKDLVEILRTKDVVSQGEWRDLEDLISSSVELLPSDFELEKVDAWLEDLAYSNDHEKIRKIFRNAFYFSFYERISNEEFEVLMKKFKRKESMS